MKDSKEVDGILGVAGWRSRGLESGLGRGAPQWSVHRTKMGLENSAIRSQERRSGLGLGLAKMYI